MIPYTVDRRPDTGVTNVTMGIWLFLASEAMLFGALFSAYALLRTAAPNWPNGREVLSLTFGFSHTVVLTLLTASAWRARSARTPETVRRWLGLASALAIVFLASKGMEYRDEIRLGLLPRVNTFLATYFVLTGLHALHVALGLAALVWAMAGATAVGPAMTAGRVHAMSLYWAFVDVVWLIILVLVYLT
jgi:heme/copper-type cytochrome/quinol oxidase subunit 3